MQTPPQLSHFDQEGQAHMVDISAKKSSHRMAIAQGSILMNGSTFLLINEGTAKKGDVLGVARIAGIMAAKKTSDLIPLCHPLALSRVTIDFQLAPPDPGGSRPDGKFSITCQCQVETVGATGVEMEAMTGVQIALLTIYDMCKAVERGMEITGVRLLEKHGGKTGSYLAASS